MGFEPVSEDNASKGVSRRGFLSGVGTAAGAAGAVVLGPSHAAAQLLERDQTTFARTDRFSRLFDRLPSFAEPTDGVAQR